MVVSSVIRTCESLLGPGWVHIHAAWLLWALTVYLELNVKI